MFETSFLFFLKALLLNIILPLVPGILFLRIFFGKRFYGMLLYLLGRFVGVGVVAFTMFNIQFIHFGVGIGEYFFILGLLLAVFVARALMKKIDVKDYFTTLAIKNIFPDIKRSYLHLSLTEKVFTWILTVFGLGFLVVTLIHTSNFPTYADDSFGNRNKATINTYYDGGIKLSGEPTEILGRGRLGYPVYVPIYKATVSHFIGVFNDIYINMRQRLSLLGILLFVFTITFGKTKNIFHSVLPVGLVAALPLLYFHSVEGYMELPCAVYSVLTIRAFRKFLEEKDYSYISLALLLGFMLSHIKNDGLLGYFAGILIAFGALLIVSKQFVSFFDGFRKHISQIYTSVFFFLFFLLPFLVVRMINHLALNPVADAALGASASQAPHREIFSLFPSLFMKMDNYNVILVVLALLIRWLATKKKDFNKLFLIGAGLTVLVIFILVFLLTENYRRVLDQTTVNRVFTMCFLMILSFAGILLHKHAADE